ncbi:MAG: hypothetical protein ACFNL3_08815, partial [Rothia aeria]
RQYVWERISGNDEAREPQNLPKVHQVGSGAFILGSGIFDNVRIFAHTPHITDVASCGFTPLGAQKVTFQPKAYAVFRAEKSLSAHNNFVCER